jgi:septal ring factor EnvC (AmiA/AmiB activator)
VPPSYSPSASLLRSARNEIERVERALGVIEQRRLALLAQLAELDAEAKGYARRRRLLEDLVEVEHATPVAELGPAVGQAKVAIRGRNLRRIAGQLLWSWQGTEQIHYREWFERVLADGYAIGGKEPAASFLTNVRDSPAVVRGTAQGYYRLDPASRERIAQEIAEAEAELTDVQQSIDRAYAASASQESVQTLRAHRDRLKQQIRRLKSDLDEIRYVFEQEALEEARASDGRSALRAA